MENEPKTETKTETTVDEEALTVKPNTEVGTVWTDMSEYTRVGRIAQMMAKTTLVPESYQGRPENCFLAINFAMRLGMEPLTVMQNLYVVKGKPSWSGQFCMALIRANPAFGNVRLVYTGQKGTDNRGAYVTAIRLSDGSVVDGTEVTIAMAKAEGWTSNPKWRNMPEQMLGYRAASFFAKLHCPEQMLGIQTAEEVEDVDTTRASTRARHLTDALRSDA